MVVIQKNFVHDAPLMARDHVKLFIPGPVEVSEATYRAMCRPMIGHRGGEFKALYAGIQPKLQELFGTSRPVFLSTSSAWGVMEGSLRNLAQKKVLNCMCGAFSDKWFDVSKRCGIDAHPLQVEWGRPITPDLVEAELAKGGFDALTLIHNETSCGLRNPLPEIAEVVLGRMAEGAGVERIKLSAGKNGEFKYAIK